MAAKSLLRDGGRNCIFPSLVFSHEAVRAQLAPQINTHNGTPSVVVVSADEWQKKTHTRITAGFLLALPLHGADLSVERETDEQRVCRDKAAPRCYVLAGTAPIEASCAHQINSVCRYVVLRQIEDCMASSTPPRRPGGAPLFEKAFQILSLLEQSPPTNTFELAAKTLIEKSGADQLLKTSGHLYVVDSLKPSSLSFLPQEWSSASNRDALGGQAVTTGGPAFR